MIDETMKDEVFEYLEDLRVSGVTNMFGARPYLVEEFGFEKQEAGEYLSAWMKSYR
jgi:hypothetical protein